MTLIPGDYYGLPTQILRNAHLRLEFLAVAGPRLVRLSLADSADNLLAEAPDFTVPTPYGPYRFRGGHRLWHAPEAMPRTYSLDDTGLTVEPLPDGVCLTQPTEPHTGIRKRIEIHLHAERPALTLHHHLTNESLWPVELAPWAITQLQLGGIGLLPQPVGPVDEAGLLPNRRVVLWPYSRWNDARLQLADDVVLVRGETIQPPFKIGYLNTHGWIGYWRAGVLFSKRFDLPGDGPYPDFGCNVEVYCNDIFFELETLGPLQRLEPGATASHLEVWEIRASVAPFASPEEAAHVLAALGLLAGFDDHHS